MNYYEINLDDVLNFEVFKMGYIKEIELVEIYCKLIDYCKNLLI